VRAKFGLEVACCWADLITGRIQKKSEEAFNVAVSSKGPDQNGPVIIRLVRQQQSSMGREKTKVTRCLLPVVLASSLFGLCTTILWAGSRFLPQNDIVMNNCWHGPYSVLNLEASDDNDVQTIKSAFYKLARQYHSDRNQGGGGDARLATAKFVTTVQAYKTLTDPEERESHERYHCVEKAGREWPQEELLLVPLLYRNRLLFVCVILVVVVTSTAVILSGLGAKTVSAPAQDGRPPTSASDSLSE
jgi:hypothetical protein